MRKPEEVAAEEELVHRPELFESRSWLCLTSNTGWPWHGPLVEELEAVPRDNRTGSTQRIIVLVCPRKSGRTGARERAIYSSQNEAAKTHGRAVRLSIETGLNANQLRATKVKVLKVVTAQSAL